jgi:hypothetical protein
VFFFCIDNKAIISLESQCFVTKNSQIYVHIFLLQFFLTWIILFVFKTDWCIFLLNCRNRDPELFTTPTKEFDEEIDRDSEEEDEQLKECGSAGSWIDDGLSSYGSALQSAVENMSDGDFSDASEPTTRPDVTKDPAEDTELKNIFMDMQVKSPLSLLH